MTGKGERARSIKYKHFVWSSVPRQVCLVENTILGQIRLQKAKREICVLFNHVLPIYWLPLSALD